MEGNTEGKTIQEFLKKATEEEYFVPILKERHERALEFLRTLGIADSAFSSTSGYYNRKESALRPSLEWMVGESVLRVKALLVTELFTKREFANEWQNLGLEGLKNADPLARIIEKAFTELSYTIDKDLVKKFLGVIYNKYNYPLPFQWNYVKPINADRGFLRILVFGGGGKVLMPETNVGKIITTYLRFYKNKFPKPHGNGIDSIAL